MPRPFESFENNTFPEPNTGCRIWGGAVTKTGYGKVGPKSHANFTLAHRYSKYLVVGEFDRKLAVLHTCDNPTCVNPDHLFLGTQLDNIKDKHNKGREAKGESIGRSKFTNELVKEIRSLYLNGMGVCELSRKYEVTNGAISKIVNRKNWRHVD